MPRKDAPLVVCFDEFELAGRVWAGEIRGVDEEVRIDKWLWSVRLFKTRALATEACKGGHVKFDGDAVKPAKPVRPGQVYTITHGGITRTVKVLAPIEKRVGPKLVSGAMEDQTPASEFLKQMQLRKDAQAVPQRARGAGRPTKKERRQLDHALEDLPEGF